MGRSSASRRLAPRVGRVLVWLAVLLPAVPAAATTWMLAVDSLVVPSDPSDCPCGDVALVGSTAWVAYMRGSGPSSSIAVQSADDPAIMDSVFVGDRPSLLALGDGRLLLASREAANPGGSRLVARSRDPGSGRWSEASPITGDPGPYDVGCGRLVITARGELQLPVVRSHPGAEPPRADVIGYRSTDGRRWKEAWTQRFDGARDPALVQLSDRRMLLVYRAWDEIHAVESEDGGRNWKPADAGIAPGVVGHAVAAIPGSEIVALAWIDRVQDCAEPCLQPIRLGARSAGATTWTQVQPLALHPGERPLALSLRFPAAGRAAWVATGQRRSARTLRCEIVEVGPEAAGWRLPDIGAARGLYVVDAGAARLALETLRAFLLARPQRAPQLFVEAYTMRAVLGAADPTAAPMDSVAARAAIAAATAYADSLVVTQNECGYWPLGYGEGWAADMAAALGLFAVLEPHVDAARLGRYQSTVERFLQSLERDRLLLPSGAVALGWPESGVCGGDRAMWRSDVGHSHEPYLVSTALAGIVLPAWLYHRSGDARHREQARRSLEFTLSQIQADGSLSFLRSKEGPYWTAAYVEQAWIAADSLLGDASVRVRLRDALRPHVEWLLRTQRPDGLWGDPRNEFARSPAIATFLLWYDTRCAPRDDVRVAILKASRRLSDRAAWAALGMVRTGIVADILRAFTAAALHSILAERAGL